MVANLNLILKFDKQNKSITTITNTPGRDAAGRDKNRIILRMKGTVNVPKK